jgi:hypothetical protein
VDRLGDDEEWSDEDLKVQVAAYLKGLGVELPAIGSYRKPGLVQKLLGR